MRLYICLSMIGLLISCLPHRVVSQAVSGNTQEVPPSAMRAIRSVNGIAVDCRLQPCMLKGDFGGEGKTDYAVLVVQKKTKARGILLVFASGKIALLGAGVPVPYGAALYRDLNFDEWEVYPKDKVIESGENQPILKLKRDSLLVSYHESASGLLYWLYGRAHWYQQGD